MKTCKSFCVRIMTGNTRLRYASVFLVFVGVVGVVSVSLERPHLDRVGESVCSVAVMGGLLLILRLVRFLVVLSVESTRTPNKQWWIMPKYTTIYLVGVHS